MLVFATANNFDPDAGKVQKNAIYQDKNTICKFSG